MALDVPRNPDNQILQIPQDRLVSELRPSFKLVSSSLQIVARPRLTFAAERTALDVAPSSPDETTTRQPFKGTSNVIWSEAFAQWTMSEHATLAFGRQNFQWGAAESLNPSNRIVHETVQAKGALYEVTGRNIARLNLSVGKSWSTVLMGEFEENEDVAPFRKDEEFESKGLVKNEISWNDGADYFGVVIGGRERHRGWFGEYVNVTVPFVDGLAIYADARHERASEAYYPREELVPTPAGPAPLVRLEQTKTDKERTYTLAVYGLKYDFEGGNSFRGEYILNDAGYSEDEARMAWRLFDLEKAPQQAPDFVENVQRSIAPGLELPGKRYAYASALVPDFFGVDDLIIVLRSLFSLSDKSTNSYGSLEYSLKGAGTLILAGSGTTGEENDELKGFVSPTVTVGYKHLW